MRSAQSGFSLVSLMVGALISIIVGGLMLLLFRQASQSSTQVIDQESSWHQARIALLAISNSVQQAGYLVDLTQQGAQSPVQLAAQSTAWPEQNGFSGEQLTVTTNLSGSPTTQQLQTTNWTLITGQDGLPALQQSTQVNNANATNTEFADGIVAMRFQLSCQSDNKYHYPSCPGGLTDARSLQIALLARTMIADPTGNNVALASYVFPDGTTYTVPTSGASTCPPADNCRQYRHQLLITEVPLRNLAWGL